MTVIGATKIRSRGPDSLNYNIVIVAEGFTSDPVEQADFQAAATTFVNDLFAFEPFATQTTEVNVHRLDVESADSGSTLVCGGGTVNTDFQAEVCASGLDRLIVVDNLLVTDEVDIAVPEWDAIVVLVNTTEYGGSGLAPVAVYSMGTPTTVPIHELGHAAWGLADEYPYWEGCGTGEIGHDNYTGVEPSEPNVTIDTNRATIKWGSFVDAATALPTTTNADCTDCDTQASPVPVGTVGAFEGGRYFHCGIFRPEFDCMMQTNGVALCAVCQDHVAGQVRAVLSGSCFVATAVYGDPAHPDVRTIRQWRDRNLRADAPMRPLMSAFTSAYGVVGPPASRWVSRRPAVAALTRRWLLEPLARRLRHRRR